MHEGTGAQSSEAARRGKAPPVRHGTTRKAVLAAAAEVFLEKGFADASIQEVAERVNIAKASAYYHVESKEHLLHEILVKGMQEGVERLREIAAYPLPARDRLRLALRANLQASVDNTFAAVASAVQRDIRFLTPAHRAEYVQLRDTYQAIMGGLLDEAIANGELRDIPGRHIALFAMFAALQNFRRWYREGAGYSVTEIADIWWDMYTKGLEPRD